MKTTEITLSLDSTPEQFGYTVSINLGPFTLDVNEGDRYLRDCIREGICKVGVPKRACNLFAKHRLYQITRESNPEIMRILKKVFLDENVKDFVAEKINGREVKILKLKLQRDETIPGLLNDPDFQKLNSGNDPK
jgi:hypothetical protein